MKPEHKNPSNSVSDSDSLLGTLPADSNAGNQSARPNTPASHDEVSLTATSLTADGVPKTIAEISSQRPKLVSVKELASLYGLDKGPIYALIKTEPDFPYINVGVKKKFKVDVAQFETWLSDRTKKEKHEHFAIPSSLDLLTVFKGKNPGGDK